MRRLRDSGSHVFLVGLVITMVLMLGFSFAGSPDPRVKIYVLAKEETAYSLSSLIRKNVSGEIVLITPQDEFNDLDILAITDCIDMTVIADFPVIWETHEDIERFLTSTIYPMRKVIVWDRFQDHEFASKLIIHFPNTKVLSELEIYDAIRKMVAEAESNPFYGFFVKATAVSSLILVGIGAAYCGSRMLEFGSKGLFSGIVEGTFILSSVFLSIQGIYLGSSRVLRMPVSLHATTSMITGMSYLGLFGGGSIPRILVAATGLTFGILWVQKRFDLRIMLVMGSMTILGLGLMISEGFNFLGGDNFLGESLLRFGYQYYKLTKTTGVIFSRGTMLFFPGLMSLVVVPRMKTSIHYFIFPFSIIVGGWGLMRVGDMRLNVSITSFIPGILLGTLSCLFILLIDEAIYDLSRIRDRGGDVGK